MDTIYRDNLEQGADLAILQDRSVYLTGRDTKRLIDLARLGLQFEEQKLLEADADQAYEEGKADGILESLSEVEDLHEENESLSERVEELRQRVADLEESLLLAERDLESWEKGIDPALRDAFE